MPPRPPVALSRRAALGLLAGGGLGAVSLSGCDVADLTGDPSDGAGNRPGDRPGDAEPDPDQDLVDRVVADVQARLADIVAARERFRPLRASLRTWEAMHRAHLAVLRTSSPTSPSAAPVAPGVPVAPAGPGRDRGRAAAGRADARLRASESAHQQVAATAALEAASGPLARLLASMAASVSQHLGVLPLPVAAQPGASPEAPVVSAWQSTLAGEHAAVYVWAVLGARTSQSASPELFEAVRATYVEHRDRRDDLIGLVAATAATPMPAATAYEVPLGLDTPAGVGAAAVALEERSTTAYAAVVGATSGAQRQQAIDWLTQSAIRVLAFRGTPEMFPGAGEHADR